MCRSKVAWNTRLCTTRCARNCSPHRAAKARKTLDGALLGTGFPFRQIDQDITPYMNMLSKVIRNTSGVRRPGAAALDLCYVAAGRLDAFFETGLAPWDLAAGSLIIREAGGIISGLDGAETYMDTGSVLCGTPKIYAELAKLCAREIKALAP